MTATLAPDEVRPVEARASVDSLGDLQQRRRDVLARLAPLKALHGHNGVWDDKRKQMLECCKVRARLALTPKEGKGPTEGAVDAAAYADPQYERFLDNGIADRIDCINLQNELDEIGERIRSRELELLVYNAELKLDR